jgi:OOP family OmpA-OmpF porin
VPDAADKCADQAETVNGFDDEDGCPDEVPAELTAIMGPVAGVSFKVNSADLLPASNKALDKLAAALVKFPKVQVEVQAHTDDQALKAGGKFADNDALSQARADAVKAYLVTKGVGENQVVAKGYGSTAPVQDPTGLKGAKLRAARKANQRVEIKLVTPAANVQATSPAETPPAETPPAETPPAAEPAPQQ